MNKIAGLIIGASLFVPAVASAEEDVLSKLLTAFRSVPATTDLDLAAPLIFEETLTFEAEATEPDPTPQVPASTTPPVATGLGSSPFTLFAIDGNKKQEDPALVALRATLASLVAQLAALTSASSVSLATSTGATTTPVEVAIDEVVRIELTRNLVVGSRGDDVKWVQGMLSDLGFFIGDITGYFGPLTRDAVRAFQADRGLPRVGEVGPRTRAEMNALDPNDFLVQEHIEPAVAVTSSSTQSTLPAGTSTLHIASTTPEGTTSVALFEAFAVPVSVSMSILPAEAPVGGSVSVTWLSQNATTCEASDGWSGTKPTIGAAVIEPLQFTLQLVLTCTGPGGSASTTATVVVGGEQ